MNTSQLNKLKGGTRWIADVLVIAGGHDTQARQLDRDLAGPETWPEGWKVSLTPPSVTVSP